MKLGILKADSVRDELQPEFGDYNGMFEKVFLRQDASLEFVHYDVERQKYPCDIDEVDLYVITGSRFSVYDNAAWIHRLSDFVKLLHGRQKPLLGICFGHQLIAQALGGKTEKAAPGWNVGIHQFHWAGQYQWRSNDSGNFNLVVSHQDQVTQLPAGAKLLAASNFCPVGAYQIDDHILCFQGHPEFPLAYSSALMELRREILGDELVRLGQQSLAIGADSAENIDCVLRFFSQ